MSRPYFETKVVKVKKEEKEKYCPCCGYKFNRETEHIKPKGNWINGENLDAIKFPCFCSYSNNFLGIIYIQKDGTYGLININKQRNKWSVEDNGWNNLENMINSYKIHILKGKVIIFEEEEK